LLYGNKKVKEPLKYSTYQKNLDARRLKITRKLILVIKTILSPARTRFKEIAKWAKIEFCQPFLFMQRPLKDSQLYFHHYCFCC
jgi:hypothetical protein